jgi:hypothetical protein
MWKIDNKESKIWYLYNCCFLCKNGSLGLYLTSLSFFLSCLADFLYGEKVSVGGLLFVGFDMLTSSFFLLWTYAD